jgi:hypothetical protein
MRVDVPSSFSVRAYRGDRNARSVLLSLDLKALNLLRALAAWFPWRAIASSKLTLILVR